MYVLALNHLIWWMKSSGVEGNRMSGSGEETKETIRPEFNRSIMIGFRGAKKFYLTEGRTVGYAQKQE
jgi:hypothetical protein